MRPLSGNKLPPVMDGHPRSSCLATESRRSISRPTSMLPVLLLTMLGLAILGDAISWGDGEKPADMGQVNDLSLPMVQDQGRAGIVTPCPSYMTDLPYAPIISFLSSM